jgi:hypothetical protein
MISRQLRWKIVSVGTGVLAGMLAKKLMRTIYQAVRKDTSPTSPFDSANARFSLSGALLWAAAAGIALGIAKIVSARIATFGWEAATGTLPPGGSEEPEGESPS